MANFGAFIDKWLGRGSALWTILAPVVPGTVGGIVTAALSRGVDWIAQYGWFGWWCMFMVGAAVVSAVVALISFAKERLVRARAVQHWSQVVDNINPLDHQFHRKRIRISDLAPPVSKKIEGKRFTDCELIGPSNIVILNNVAMQDIEFLNCDIVPTKRNVRLFNVIGVEGSQIVGGSIQNATIFVHPDALGALEAAGAFYYPTLTGDPQIDARNPQ